MKTDHCDYCGKAGAFNYSSIGMRLCGRCFNRRLSQPMADRRPCAAHEAGHAVVARYYGCKVKSVDVFLLRGGGGKTCDLKPNLLRWPEATALEAGCVSIQISFAGPMAERRWRKAHGCPGFKVHSVENDYHSIDEILDLLDLHPAEIDRIINRARRRTSRILTDCWPAVEALTKALCKHERLGLREVRRIVDARLPAQFPVTNLLR